MKTPIPDYLATLLDSVKDDTSGSKADYIPALEKAPSDRLAIALTTVDGRTYSAGDDDIEFTIQSISKPFAYAAALMDRGIEEVNNHIECEPSGEAFNSLSLDEKTYRPKNSMINAGAITAHHLLVGPSASKSERVTRAVDFFSDLAGRELTIDREVFESELKVADRNLAIAHMLKNYGILSGDPHAIVEGYTAQCSILVTVKDIAMMAAVLSAGGVHPISGKRLIPSRLSRQTLSIMATAGMYDAAGSWFTEVGIPAKSGVAGGLLGALPGQVGIGAFSPRLDAHGNSVRSIRLFQKLSDDMGMHVLEAHAYGSEAVRECRVDSYGTYEVVLQGVVDFVGAEAALYKLADPEQEGRAVHLDLSRVDGLTDVARRMLNEGTRRLHEDGVHVTVTDSENLGLAG